MRRRNGWNAAGALALALALALGTVSGPAGALAQESSAEPYVIGAEDVLTISVWMRPELERTVTVNSQGNVVFPPVGEIQAAGLTRKQLSDRVGDRLSAYLRQTVTVTVTVTQFVSRSVIVAGAVARPGRYGFERIPGLLEVINQAGGALPGADLGRVQVVRRDGQALRTLTADLAAALAEGGIATLPALEPGDVLVVPATGAVSGVSPDAVGVLGEVHRPGLYAVGDGQDLWMVLAQAGGPTPRGNLGAIRVLTREGEVRSVVTVDLHRTLGHGSRAPYLVRPGDIVYLDPKGASLWSGFVQLMGVTRDALNLVLLSQLLDEQKK